jgi:DNA modification methylase
VKPYLLARGSDLVAQRPADATEDVHFTESLATEILEAFTAPGARVLDPFAGFGTTLVVAARLGRSPVGVELLDERVAIVRRRIGSGGRIIQGDARRLADLVEGPFELCLTSPPYMTVNDHPENPLTGYETSDGDYRTYLAELDQVFAQVASLLRVGGHAVVNVANISHLGIVTTLAWDVGRVVSRHLRFRQEVFVCWDQPPPDLTGDYCLVYERTA